jgi:hypothetical protein
MYFTLYYECKGCIFAVPLYEKKFIKRGLPESLGLELKIYSLPYYSHIEKKGLSTCVYKFRDSIVQLKIVGIRHGWSSFQEHF